MEHDGPLDTHRIPPSNFLRMHCMPQGMNDGGPGLGALNHGILKETDSHTVGSLYMGRLHNLIVGLLRKS